MHPWQHREQELLRKENEWFEHLPAWMKVIDNDLYFVLLYVIATPVWFGIGLLIGLLL